MFSTFKGYRTYIIAIIGIVLTGAHAMGYLNDSTYEMLVGLFTSLGLGFLRAAVQR